MRYQPVIVLLALLFASFAYGEEALTSRYYNGIGVTVDTVKNDKEYHCWDEKQGAVRWFRVDHDSGVRVVNVRKDSPAEAAGLHCGDIITAVDDRSVVEETEVIELITKAPANTAFRLTLWRPVVPAHLPVTDSKTVHEVHLAHEERFVRSAVLDRIVYKRPDENKLTASEWWSTGGIVKRAVSSESYFELTDDRVRYTCIVRNSGPQVLQHVRAPFFSAMGFPEAPFVLKPTTTMSFIFSAEIAEAGIPVSAEVPLQFSDEWMEESAKRLRERNKDLVFVEDGRWYIWQGAAAHCWMPEAYRRKLRAMLRDAPKQ